MGLFSSEKRTSVGTQVTRVITDAMLPDAVKSGLFNALFSGDDIPSSMMESLIGSVGVKAEQMYDYGRTKYAHGLPSGDVYSALDGKSEVTSILSGIEGTPILLEYSHFRPRNLLHIGWLKLHASHGYDPVTNKLANLSAAKGKPVYLGDMMVMVPEASFSSYRPGALDLWGIPAKAGYTPLRRNQALTGAIRAPSPVVASPTVTTAHVRVEYIWEGDWKPLDGVFEIMTGSFEISVDEYVTQSDYFHAKYTANDVTKYWMYKVGTGTYPALDNLFTEAVKPNGTFFPFAYFRYNGVAGNADKTTAAYRTSKKLVKYLGMDYDQICDKIKENPNIANVQQAMTIMAVPATTVNPLEQRYLFSFFDNLFYSVGNQYSSAAIAENARLLSNGSAEFTKATIVIQDKRFKMSLSHDGVFKKRVGGQIGPVGTHNSSMEVAVVEEDYKSGWQDGFAIKTRLVDVPVHVYRRQVTKHLYDEVRVFDLKVQYYVLGEYFVTGQGSQDILLIPLDHSITEHFSVSDRETLYSRSLHFVFNSFQETTLAWYQTGLFGAFMMIVSFVVIVLSFGTAGGPMASLMAAIQAGSTVALTVAVLALLQQILVGLLISYVLKLFAKAVGGEVAIFIAIAAMIYAGYDSYAAGSLKGAPWAQELLQISSGLTKAVTANLQDSMRDLLAEYQSFNLFKDEATKQLEAANKLLDHKSWLSPFVIFGESPNDYYNRTIHSGNVGVLGISAISSYVDTALTLPKMDQSIGGAT